MLNLQQAEAVLDTVQSFVDMRAFARDKRLGIALTTAAGADPFLSSRRVLDWEQSHVTAGVIALDAGSGSVPSLPADEFIIVNEGRLTLTQQGSTLTLVEKQSAAIKESPEMGPSAGGPAADLLLTPKPVCRNHTDYKTADGEFTCGTWDSTPYTRRALYFRHMELMHLLEGTATFVDEAGRSGTFSKGDIFLLEQKAPCTWESLVNVAKVYVIYRPA